LGQKSRGDCIAVYQLVQAPECTPRSVRSRSELPPDVLSPRMVRVIEGLPFDWHRLEERSEGLPSEIEELAKRDAGS